jgi:hypothetical protein
VYDAVVLVNVPCGGPNGLNASQDSALARYVKDLGGGLIAIGGTNTFGAGGWGGTELEKVLPVNCQPPADDPMAPGALVIAIDRSASMGERPRGSTRTKQELANESAAMALRSLLPCDRAGVIAFNSTPQWIVPLTDGVQRQGTDAAIRGISSGGETEIDTALVMACDALGQVSPAPGARHVLLLTDGRSRDVNLMSTVAAMQRAGVTLSTVGIGDDVDQRLLDFLAWMGHGQSYRVTDPAMLPLVVIRDARLVDGALVRERPFTPRFTGVGDWSGEFSPLPPLRGLVVTWPKRSPAVRTSIVDDGGEPVLAHWKIGMGRAAAFMSDAGPRWAGAWIESPVFEHYWGRVLHTVLRPDPPTGAAVRILATSPDRAEVIVESPAAEGSAMAATLIAPDDQQPATNVRLIRAADGSYRGDFATPDNGTYIAVVHDSDSISLTPAIYVASASAELSDLQSNEQAVRDIAQRTGGRLLPPFDPKANLFDRAALKPQPVSLPLTDKLVVLSIITLLLDVAVRRLAWDKRTFASAAAALAESIRSFTRVRVGDPEFSVASLLYVHACLNERRQQRYSPVKISPAKPDRCRDSIGFTVRDSNSKTIERLLSSHRQRSGENGRDQER